MNTQDTKAGSVDENGAEAKDTKRRTRRVREEREPESEARAGAVARLAEKFPADKIVEYSKDLPQIIEREMKKHPYRAVGVAAGVGFGVGAVVGSRLLRMALLATGGFLASEVARGRMKKLMEELADALDQDPEEDDATSR